LVGTGVCLVIERDTITLAKEVASLDHVSGGRFLFGIGGGWNYEEMENHGTNPKTRWRKLREQMLAMKEIWTKDEPEFHGEFVNFDTIWQWPKPIQKPHPPILVGGSGPRTLDRVVEYGDGWMPIGGRGGVPIEEKLAELNDKATAAGRSGPFEVTIFGMRPDRAEIERYEKAGVARVTFGLPAAGAAETLPVLDNLARFVAEYGSSG
ncbi:MAG TPA: TIGR03619 family F420-dependent LLM class oxidoreductase, partial [Dehalococcoidia bacterium]|nr:TIGR03619 family F420-dependent LLM class oxidoreductase [Dehalococcoidia bacterium]